MDSRTKIRRCARQIEALESRVLLSAAPAYEYDVIAHTGQNAGGVLTGFGTGPSINDSGTVAFVGKHAKGDALFVGSGTPASAKELSPEFDNDSTRTFGQAVQINNSGKVVAQARVAENDLLSFIQVWNSAATNSFTTVATANSGGFGNFAAVFPFPGIDASGQTAFGALNFSGQRLLADPSGSSFNSDAIAGVLSPSIADNGDVVVRAGSSANSPIELFSPSLKPLEAIASSNDFSTLGAAPSISHDGHLVAFYGVLTSGGAASLNASQKGWTPLQSAAGIFVAIQTAGKAIIQRVAGTSGTAPTFPAFSADTRVAVNDTAPTQSAATVAFLATGTDGKQGLYSAKVQLLDGAGPVPKPTSETAPITVTSVKALAAALVVEVGQTITGVSGHVTSIGINDPINAGGQIAFQASTDVGAQAIVRAAYVPPKIVLDEATTLDAKSVTVTYDVSEANISAPLTFDVYRSNKPTMDSASTLVGSQTILPPDPTDDVGHHVVTLLEGTSLPPNPSKPYIVVVADANGSVQEAAGSENSAYFQTFVLGALAHGYTPLPPYDDGSGLLGSNPPNWEPRMAADLIKYDHYNQVIQLNWVTGSRLTIPDANKIPGTQTPYYSYTVQAAYDLRSQVVTAADKLAAAHTGDVVDLHFIGHSRGCVVITQAIKLLAGTTDPALEGSYIQATLLDPHPANATGAALYAARKPIGVLDTLLTGALKTAVITSTLLCFDPEVTITSNVDEVDDYYQKTANNLGFQNTDPVQYNLNLWGEGPNDKITNNSSAKIRYTNLTNVTDNSPGVNGKPIGLIGHGQVVDWYLVHVVDAGLLGKGNA